MRNFKEKAKKIKAYVPVLVMIAMKFIPEKVWEKNLAKAEGMWSAGKPKKWYFTIPMVLFWLIIIFLICDMRLKTVEYKINSEKVNEPVTIALITDLHSDWYGKEQKTLIKAVDKQKPDVVLLGGDIFDDKKSYDNAKETLKALSEKYKCYYVPGNHEYWSKDIANIFNIVESYGITILYGDVDVIEINGQKVNICGVVDPDESVYLVEYETTDEQLKKVYEKINLPEYKDNYTVVLSHRPELYETYAEYGFDLVLSGHAHGGQWRIPFVLNGLYAPDQGLFPEYAGGKYDYNGGCLIVSRGLARESTPVPRIFNRPELVIVNIE